MSPDRGTTSIPSAEGPGRSNALRLAPIVVIVLLGVLVVAMGWHRQLSFEALVRHRAVLDDFVAAHYAVAVASFIAVYVAVVSLSVPGAAFLTITGGLLFGTLIGGAAAVTGATIGATVIFLIARSALSAYVLRRAGPRLSRIVDGFHADAFSYLLFLRLVPVFPFFLVNLAPALVGVRLPVFVAATALGIVPATFVFASVGAGLDSIVHAQGAAYHACLAAGGADCRLDFDPSAALTPQLIGALVALGLLALVPVAVKKAFPRKEAHVACKPREPA